MKIELSARPLSLDFTYGCMVSQRKNAKSREELDKLSEILEKFRSLRDLIFNLRYDAENIDTSIIDEVFQSQINELDLILPVIKKLSDTAEFISQRDLAKWRENNYA